MASRNENPFESNTEERKSRREPTDRNKREGRKRNKRRMWPWMLLLFLAAVFFLPMIVGQTALKDKAIKYATSDFNGTVNVDHVSLGWFSPVKLKGISVLDAESQPLLQVDEVTTTKPLLGFITGSDYGEVVISQPVMHLLLRPDGSNLEDALAKYISVSATEPKNELQSMQPFRLPAMTVKCVGGRAVVTSVATNEQWDVDGLNVVAKTNTLEAPLALEVQCQFLDQQGSAIGGFATNCQVDGAGDALAFNSAQIAINSQHVPLALAAPIANRFVGPTQTAGYATGELQLAYSAPGNEISINVSQMEITDAAISAPQFIGPDSFHAKRLTASGQLNISPQLISATKFVVESEFATLNADGMFEPNQLSNLVSEGQLVSTPFHMEGAVDVARVATMLPNTLQLHEDLKIQSGVVSFQASSRQKENAESSQNRIVVNVDTANIRAKRGNQDIVWQKPLRVAGVVNQVNGQFAIEDVIVDSDFLTMRGAGSIQTGNFEANGDLAKLVERVSQFADLGGAELAGTLHGQFGWKLAPVSGNENSLSLQNRPINIGGRFNISNPSIKWPTLPLWEPEQIAIQLVSNGKSIDKETISIEGGNVNIVIGNEKLKANMAEPVANLWQQQSWKFNCAMTGRLAGWLGHAKNFVDLGDIAGDGDVNLNCIAHVDTNVLKLHQINAAVDQFGFDGYGMIIREPRLESKANLNYNFANGNVSLSKIAVAGRSIAANSETLLVTFAPNMQVQGDVKFQGDVNRIADWYGLSPNPTDIRWYGTLQGTASLASNENGIGGRVVSRVTDLLAAQPVKVGQQAGSPMQTVSNRTEWQEIWKEANVDIQSDVQLSNDFDSIRIQDLNVNSSSLMMKTQGTVSQLTSAFLMDLAGSWNPNWQMVNSLLDAYTGKMARFSGSGEQPFIIRGPLFGSNAAQAGWIPPQLQMNTNVAWEAADIFNFVLGPNKLNISVDQSVAHVTANSVSVLGGSVNLNSTVDMRETSPLLFIDQGPVAENIQLTPETCREWMKYVAPIFADATSAQGTFSINSRGMQVPLMEPMTANAQGTIRLSNVTIGAGPLADQLLSSINQIRSIVKPNSSRQQRDHSTWLRMEEQEVPFAVQNQRIFHDGIKFSHDEVTIRTKGSVGIDQTLNMVAEIPLADEWLDSGDGLLQSLKGQSISIPISGTVMRPQLDKRAFQQLTQQIVKSAAGSALNKVVQDKLGGSPQRIINDRINEGVGNVQEKINNKLQEEIGDKIGGELMNGLNGLFKRGGGQ